VLRLLGRQGCQSMAPSMCPWSWSTFTPLSVLIKFCRLNFVTFVPRFFLLYSLFPQAWASAVGLGIRVRGSVLGLVIVSLRGYIWPANPRFLCSVRSAAVSQRSVCEEELAVLTVMDAYSFSCFHLSSKQLMCKNNIRVTSCWNVVKSFVFAGAFVFVWRQHQCAWRIYVTCRFVSSFGFLLFLFTFVFTALKQSTYGFGKKCFKLFFVGSFCFCFVFLRHL